MKGELLKGHLELLILSALAAGPGHGYAIIRAIRERSQGEIELLEGSIYPALHRLEAAALVSSAWVESSGRRRRVYTLTAKGRRSLGEQARDWHAFERALNLVIEGA